MTRQLKLPRRTEAVHPEALQVGGLKKFADNPIGKILGGEL
jgi:hypothetical protein